MKKIISSIITIIILSSTNLLMSKVFKLPFVELSFITGLLFTIGIYFFTSSGGFTSEMMDASIKRFLESDSRTSSHFVNFNVNIPFIISLFYTIISGIYSIIVYWEYF